MKTKPYLLPVTGLLLSAGCWDTGDFYFHHHHHHCPGGWDPATWSCQPGDGGTDLGRPSDLGGSPQDLASAQDLSGPAPDLVSSLPDLAGVPSGSYLWARQYDSAGSNTAFGVAADAAGNVIVTGSFQGTVNFGGGPVTASGASDVFVTKLGPDGSFQWAQDFGGTGTDAGYSVAVDAGGNILVAGTFQSTISIGGSNLSSNGGYDVLLLKLSPSGTVLWAHGYGGPLDDAASSVAADPSGNALVTGYFDATASFGGAPLTSAGAADVFLAKYGADGSYQWSQGFGGPGADVGNRVTTDSAGNVALVGQFVGTASFGGVPLAAGGTAGFLGKYSPSGTYTWSRSLGGTSVQVANGVAVDGSGNISVLGSFQGSADFGGGMVTATGTEDAYLAQYNSSGTYQWAQDIGGPTVVTAGNLAGSADGSLVITGSANSGFSVGTVALDTGGIFVARLSSTGTARWAQSYAVSADGVGLGVAVDPQLSVLVSGNFAGSVNLGGGPLSSTGAYDGFVLKLTP